MQQEQQQNTDGEHFSAEWVLWAEYYLFVLLQSGTFTKTCEYFIHHWFIKL